VREKVAAAMVYMSDNMMYYITAAIGAFVAAHFLGSIRADNMQEISGIALYVRFAAHFLRILGLAAIAVLIATELGLDVKSLSGSLLTSGSLVFGFASQDVLKNFAAGLVILLSSPFRVGDKITCDGKTGLVIEVGFFSTRLKTADQTGLSLPNAKVASGVMVNHTDDYGIARTGMHRVHVEVHLSVNADLDLAEKSLAKVAKDMDSCIVEMNVVLKSKPSFGSYHFKRFGVTLEDDQKTNPCKVNIIGQNMASGFQLELLCFCTTQLVTKVNSEGFRRAVRALKADGLELFDPRQRLHDDQRRS